MAESDRSDVGHDEPADLTAFGAIRSALRRGPAEPDADAVAAVEELFPEGAEFREYLARFCWLIALSASIAAFGLLADSAAVVIGAMLVAPLMTPITAVAAALVTARNVRLVRSIGVIVVGIVGAVAVGWIVAEIAGSGVISATQVPQQVRDRTFPGLLDLGIAVTAGAAAGYILPRRSAVSALPGVGIAVALVPPLATVGITFSAGVPGGPRNAFLLFLTNLAAIVFAASIMLLLAGFRPHTEAGRRAVSSRIAVSLLAVAVVAVPLTIHTRSIIRENRLQSLVSAAVTDWDPTVRVIELDTSVAGDVAEVDLLVSGQDPTRRAWRLAEDIRERFGGPVELRLVYQEDRLYVVSAR